MASWGQTLSKKQPTGSRSPGRKQREVGTREVRQRFLIVCEGEQTEPAYFKAFQTRGLFIDVKGTSRTCLELVKRARQYEEAKPEGTYHQIWLVFDRDDCPADLIHRTFEQAKSAGYRVAFSNQAFELWFLLHFDYCNTALSRDDYCDRLDQRLGCVYKKNDKKLYYTLEQRQAEAINNARRLLEQCEHSTDAPCAHCNPCTTVHMLVEELNKHQRP